MQQASDVSSDFVLVPWSEHGSITEDTSVPFLTSAQDRYTGRGHLEFIQEVLQKSVCNTGIFINHALGGPGPAERSLLKRTKSAMSIHSQRDSATTLPVKDKSHQIFFPFFGGIDDRVALRFALQLAKNSNVVLTVAHLSWPGDDGDDITMPKTAVMTTSTEHGSSNSNLPSRDINVKEVDDVSAQDLSLLSSLQSSLPRELVGRFTFVELHVSRGTATAEAVAKARTTVGNMASNAGDIIVVGRSHASLGDSTSEGGSSGDLRRTVGVVADQLLHSGVKASVLVVKAGGPGMQL